MKIIFTCPNLALGGGAERCVCTLANFWAEKGYEVSVITLHQEEPSASYSLHQRVELIALNCFSRTRPMRNLAALLKLRAVIRKLNPEIVISFIGPINLITILACLGLRSVIVSERTNPKRADIAWTTKLLIGLTYPMAKTVVAQTNQVISSLPALSRKKAIAIPNPLAEEIQNCQASIDYENKTIVAVGRLERVKGFDLLLDAFSEIHKDFSDWRLNIWGAGSQEPAIQSQIKSLQLESVVRLNPPTTDLVAAYTSGSIFVLPSRSEGFPNALCEASALGLAVIASDCNFGPREIIEQNISGILVQPESSASLRDALLLLVQDVELRTTLGTNARKISSKLQVGKIAELWESIF